MPIICRCLAMFTVVLALAVLLAVPSVHALETGDSQIFLAGFNAYQQKDYTTAVTRLGEVLQKFPDSPLRDMTLFWLARSHFKAGNRQDAVRYMSQFTKEYPDNPLKNTVEDELLNLVAQHEKSGQPLAAAKVGEDSRRKAETERVATETAQNDTAEKARRLKAKAEADRTAREEAERHKRAEAAKAESERVAQLKATEDRKRQEEAERMKLAAAKAEEERLAQAKAQAELAAKAKAETERLTALKAEEERKQREEAERRKLASAKAEEERLAQAKAQAELAAKAKAEADRLAQQKAETERIAQLKASEERKQQEEAERRKLAAAKAEEERLAQAKAQAELAAKAKAEADRLASLKAAEEQRAAEKAAVTRKQAAEQQQAEKAREEQRVMREKAINEYKGIVARFPGTPAAQTAAARLKDLGISTPAPAAAPVAAPVASPLENAQVLSLEVAQYAAFDLTVQTPRTAVEVARYATVPFEVVNRGNGPDSFYLAASFPAEYGARFAAATAPDQAINQTPVLAPGERFNGQLQVQIPAATIDGLRITHPVRAASRFSGEISQSREILLTASAPLLRAVVKSDKAQLAPGERVMYRVTLLNVGSMPANEVTLRLNFPAQYEPVDVAAGGFRQEMKAALVLDGLQLKSGESREFIVPFQLKEEALAKEELVVRADLLNNPLKINSAFHASTVFVQPVSAVSARIAGSRVVVIPGQTITIPATVVNNGNQRESFSIVAAAPAARKITVYHDLNRDGLRQPNEPSIASIGPLTPREEAALLLEVETNQTAQDASEAGVTLSVAPESSQGKAVVADTRIVFSRPVVQFALKGRGGLLVPGELITVDLQVFNAGSNLAKRVELLATWPEQLELVAADPSSESPQTTPGAGWRLSDLGAGEKRLVKATFRVKPGTGVGTGIQLKSVLSYFDQLGNRY